MPMKKWEHDGVGWESHPKQASLILKEGEWEDQTPDRSILDCPAIRGNI